VLPLCGREPAQFSFQNALPAEAVPDETRVSRARTAILIGPAQFAREPTQRIRFNRVGGKRSDFGNSTLQTLEPAVLEAIRTVRDGVRSHPLLAFWTKRTVDWQ
jgi:hypothetical protein